MLPATSSPTGTPGTFEATVIAPTPRWNEAPLGSVGRPIFRTSRVKAVIDAQTHSSMPSAVRSSIR
jgi:hypothetical protein